MHDLFSEYNPEKYYQQIVERVVVFSKSCFPIHMHVHMDFRAFHNEPFSVRFVNFIDIY